jgi:hypothetical protein
VLNEAHRARFEANRGLERFTIAHEAGHADVFALAAEADQHALLVGAHYQPERRSATKGQVLALHVRLRDLPREIRTEILLALAQEDRVQRASGEDSPLERRAVDHYAAVLLMPEDLIRTAISGRDLTSRATHTYLAREFEVSVTAMRIRLEELGLIPAVDHSGGVILTDPANEGQGSLF